VFVDRHQLDGGDAQVGEVGRLGLEAVVGSAQGGGDGRVVLGEATQVDLVDDRVLHRLVRPHVAGPVEGAVIDDDRLRHGAGAVDEGVGVGAAQDRGRI